MDFQRTGRLPEQHVPGSPLLTLLDQIGPGYLAQIKGLTVDHRLGYNGSRQFQWAAQAKTWLNPGNTVHAPASHSWQNKRFAHKLYLEDLAECCAQFPEFLYDKCRHLRRPSEKKATPTP